MEVRWHGRRAAPPATLDLIAPTRCLSQLLRARGCLPADRPHRPHPDPEHQPAARGRLDEHDQDADPDARLAPPGREVVGRPDRPACELAQGGEGRAKGQEPQDRLAPRVAVQGGHQAGVDQLAGAWVGQSDAQVPRRPGERDLRDPRWCASMSPPYAWVRSPV
jgi:hypothetical protein